MYVRPQLLYVSEFNMAEMQSRLSMISHDVEFHCFYV